eukprot:scaffold17062_cov90-Isochrysis_galbana.AAC.2
MPNPEPDPTRGIRSGAAAAAAATAVCAAGPAAVVGLWGSPDCSHQPCSSPKTQTSATASTRRVRAQASAGLRAKSMAAPAVTASCCGATPPLAPPRSSSWSKMESRGRADDSTKRAGTAPATLGRAAPVGV